MRFKRQQVKVLSVVMLAGVTWYATTHPSSVENVTMPPSMSPEQPPGDVAVRSSVASNPAAQPGRQLSSPGVDLGLAGLEDRPEIELVEGLFSPPTYGLSNWMSLDQRLRRNLSQMLIDRAKLELVRGNREAARAAAREALDQVLTYASPAVPSDLKPPMGRHGEHLSPPPGTGMAPGADGSSPKPPGTQASRPGEQGGLGPPLGGPNEALGKSGPSLRATGGPKTPGGNPGAQASGVPGELGRPGEQMGPPPGQESGSPQDLDARPFGPRVRNAFEHGWFGAAALCFASLWPEQHALLDALPAARLRAPEGAVTQGVIALLRARDLEAQYPERSRKSAMQAFARLSEATSRLLDRLKQEPTLSTVQGYHTLAGDPMNVAYIWGWLSPDYVLDRLGDYLAESNRLSGAPSSHADQSTQLQAAIQQIRKERRQPAMSSAPYWTTDRALGRVPT